MYRLARLSLTFPRTALAVVAVITLSAGVGMLRLRTEFGFRVLLGSEHPAIVKLEHLIDRFGRGLPIQIAWLCGEGRPCQHALDAKSLMMSHELISTLSSHPRINRVIGPSNAPILVGAPGGFSIRNLVENEQIVPDYSTLAAYAYQDRLWARNFVSDDRSIAALLIQPIDIRSDTDVHVVDAVQRALAPFRAQGFEYHLVGNAVSAVISGRDLAASTARIIPFTVLIVAAILYALLRSWALSLAALATIGVALCWTFGVLGWIGWPQDAILEVLAPLILVVGICDAIHLLSRYSFELHANPSELHDIREQNLLRAARDVANPCLLTTLTTAAAFSSFTTSALETFVRFGAISAFGVMACLILTFVFLPPLTLILPVRQASHLWHHRAWTAVIQAVIRTTQRRPGSILGVSAGLLLFCGIGWVFHLRVDTYWYELVGEHSETVRSMRFLEKHLRSSASLEVEIELPTSSQITDPEVLEAIGRYSDFLSGVNGLRSPSSVLDLLLRLNRLLHDDDPFFERPGSTDEANAELIELLEMNDPEVLEAWMTIDRSRLRISAESDQLSNSERARVLRQASEYSRSFLDPGWNVQFNGSVAVNHAWVGDIMQTQLRSFPTAFGLVFVMVTIFFRSIQLATAAMVPTLLPVVVTLGSMGWMGMSLDVGRAMIAAVLIGIAVDDSIHILFQYQKNRDFGAGPRESIEGALRHAGAAVVTTSVALSLGFLALVASAWQTLSSFGFFVSLAILGALASTLFVLPAAIVVLVGGSDD